MTSWIKSRKRASSVGEMTYANNLLDTNHDVYTMLCSFKFSRHTLAVRSDDKLLPLMFTTVYLISILRVPFFDWKDLLGAALFV